jgi:tight adherence protein C
LSARVGRLIASEEQLARQLVAAGRSESPIEFRARQFVLWAAAAGFGGLFFALLRAGGVGVSLEGGALSATFLGVGGPALAQVRLRVEAARRRLRVELELPAVASLLSLCMAAGETLTSAIVRVAATAGGVLGAELRRVNDEVRQGASLSEALGALSRRLDVVAATRLVDTLELARERGVPVAAVLRSQSSDLRQQAARKLVETAGRRQVLMLAPVIFLILPVCVLFALYPALVSLRLLSR